MTSLQAVATGKSEYDKLVLLDKISQMDHSQTMGDKLGEVLEIAGAEGLYCRAQIMDVLAVLLTVSGVVEDLDPGHDLSQELMGVMLE